MEGPFSDDVFFSWWKNMGSEEREWWRTQWLAPLMWCISSFRSEAGAGRRRRALSLSILFVRMGNGTKGYFGEKDARAVFRRVTFSLSILYARINCRVRRRRGNWSLHHPLSFSCRPVVIYSHQPCTKRGKEEQRRRKKNEAIVHSWCIVLIIWCS